MGQEMSVKKGCCDAMICGKDKKVAAAAARDRLEKVEKKGGRGRRK